MLSQIAQKYVICSKFWRAINTFPRLLPLGVNYYICHLQYLNCRGDASSHRDLASPLEVSSAGWTDKKEPGSTNKSHKFRPNFVPNCGEHLFFLYLFIFFGLHSISGTERHNFHKSTFPFRMRLVKTAKASPHAKFYSLSTGHSSAINSNGLAVKHGQSMKSKQSLILNSLRAFRTIYRLAARSLRDRQKNGFYLEQVMWKTYVKCTTERKIVGVRGERIFSVFQAKNWYACA